MNPKTCVLGAAAASLCLFLSSPVVLSGENTQASVPSCKVLRDADGLRRTLPECWYQKAAGLKVVTFKKNLKYAYELSLNPVVLATQLEEIRGQGFSAIEIFAPAEGLTAYNGLDTKNHYRIDPELGDMNDFRRAVRLAHSKQLAAIVFINLGYFSVDAPDWIQASSDKKAGVLSDKAKWFLWADKLDAPEPHTQEDVYWTRADRERSKAFWGWKYSDKAASYFWARWKAEGPDKSVIPLPQVNWDDPGWRKEAERIVGFWMDTGIDGMLIDAPLCYPNQTWAHNLQHITSVIASYGNTLVDPEGGRDTAWITEAGYNTLHDYSVDYVTAIDSGNLSQIERDLRWYHDSVVENGGVLYSRVWTNHYENDPALQRALMVGAGGIVVYTKSQGSPDAEEVRNLHFRRFTRQPLAANWLPTRTRSIMPS